MSLLTPDEDYASKALVFLIVLYQFMCRRLGEYISLELFHFVSLISSCSLIPWIPHRHDRYPRLRCGGYGELGSDYLPDDIHSVRPAEDLPLGETVDLQGHRP